MDSNIDFLRCAQLILKDQCPPETKMWLCDMEEDFSDSCTLCWQNYLDYLASNRTRDPYKWDRKSDVK